MKSLVAVVACCVTIMQATAARANGLSITPLRAQLSPDVRIAQFTVISNEPAPTLVEIHLFAWTQSHGVDQLTPSDDLIVGPPIFTLGPGQSQLIRVGLRTLPMSSREMTYRMILAEVPTTQGQHGVSFVLRLSLPIFVNATAVDAPQVHWSVEQSDASHVRLTLDNSGDQHIRVDTLRLAAGPGATPFYKGVPAVYVLAGQQRSWRISVDKDRSIRTVYIQATLEGHEVGQTVNVKSP